LFRRLATFVLRRELNCEYLEQFKDGLNEGEGVGVAQIFSRKLCVTRASTGLLKIGVGPDF